MICVYKGRGASDAFLLRHWLLRNHIAAVLRGGLPIADTWSTLWVAKADKERAEAAIREFNAPRLVYPRWICSSCGEENEPSFGSCWSCSADRPGLG